MRHLHYCRFVLETPAHFFSLYFTPGKTLTTLTASLKMGEDGVVRNVEDSHVLILHQWINQFKYKSIDKLFKSSFSFFFCRIWEECAEGKVRTISDWIININDFFFVLNEVRKIAINSISNYLSIIKWVWERQFPWRYNSLQLKAKGLIVLLVSLNSL